MSRQSNRSWMFTLNNFVHVQEPRRWADHCEFLTWQAEDTLNNPHLQGYLVLKENPTNSNGRTLAWMKREIDKHAHFEPRRGTHAQAVAYCNKEDTRTDGPWTIGEWSDKTGPSRGGVKGGKKHAENVVALLSAVKAGADDEQILEDFPRLAMSMTKGIDRARLVYAQKKPRVQPYIVVLHGETGTGKSHKAQAIADANGGGFTFRKGNSGNMWADGYDPLRHPVCIFDEMDGAFMPYRQLLRVCDKWPLVLDTKGGAVNFSPKIIVFTSHKHPKDWYSTETVKDTTEMMRRMTGKYGAIIEMKTVFKDESDPGPDLSDVIDLLESGDLVKADYGIVDLTEDDDEVEHVALSDDEADEAAWNVESTPRVYCDCMYGDLPCDIASTGIRAALTVGPPVAPLNLPGRFKKPTSSVPVQRTLSFKRARSVEPDDDIPIQSSQMLYDDF